MDVTIMRSFNKLANLHRVFFKRAEESFGNRTTNSPIDDLNKGVMAGGEKYPGQFMSLANPANDQGYFNNHNMPRAHPGPGQGRFYTGIEAPASKGVSPLYRSQGRSAIPPAAKPTAPTPPAVPGVFSKTSDALDGGLRGGIYGAALGGLGTAGYDFINNNKGTLKDRLLRALSGAGVGAIGGAGLGAIAGGLSEEEDRPRRRRSSFIPEETPSPVLSPSREESPLSIGSEREDRPNRPSFLPEGNPRSVLGQ